MENNNINNFMEDEDILAKEKKRWVFFGLPFTFTTYTITQDILTIDSGFFKKVENDCYMYKVQDVELKQGFVQRWFKLGDVICYTGDTTHPELILKNIKNSKRVKDILLKNSEKARLKRRTINTLDIGTGDMSDMIDL